MKVKVKDMFMDGREGEVNEQKRLYYFFDISEQFLAYCDKINKQKQG